MPVDGDAGDQSHAQSGGDSNDFTRLHITPFDADLFNIVVPASMRPSARNSSFHTVETFPERRFGFVDLPTADAEKLKSKLNGTVLKGAKMRIQEATPEAKIEPGGFDPESLKKKKDKKSKKRSEDIPERSSKKRKRDGNVVRGVLLEDRKVQRGWTETPDYKQKKQKRKEKGEKGEKDKEKKKRTKSKSKYTEKEECLLKTTVPPNLMKNLPEDVVQDKRRKKKKGGDREFIVHEFEKTTKFPSFLKTSSSGESRKAATEFVAGKGWVDEDGNVVEVEKVSNKPEPKARKKTPPKPKKKPVEDSDDETSSSGTSSDETSDDDSEVEEEPLKEDVDMSSDTSSSGEEETDDKPASQFTTPKTSSTSNRPTSSGSAKSLKLQIPASDTPTQEVHPLEALYKKKKPEDDTSEAPAQGSEPFTFFGGDVEDEDEDEDDDDDNDERMDHSTPMPTTPYASQDLENRNIRSAAPTPDTAHPTRMRNIWAALHRNDEDMDDVPEMDGADEEDEGNGQPSAGNAGKDAGDFQSWFWENRGDLNRSWMKRRKMAAKEKRHRENKARASKAV